MKAASADWAERIELDRALASQLASVQQEVASVTDERQLLAASADGSAHPGVQEQEQTLLDRLVKAHDALKNALKRRKKNGEELRKCAGELVSAMDEYLCG